jgi:hypothetical protein
MPLAGLNIVALFARAYSLFLPRLLTDEISPNFVGRALVLNK